MLAKPAGSLEEIFQKISGTFVCEFKYDGFRAQVHRFGSNLRIYSRA